MESENKEIQSSELESLKYTLDPSEIFIGETKDTTTIILTILPTFDMKLKA
jgi:hypothetical protein